MVDNQSKLGQKVVTVKDLLILQSLKYSVKLFMSDKKLPAWGNGKNEINGIFNAQNEAGNVWTVRDVQHKRVVNGITHTHALILLRD